MKQTMLDQFSEIICCFSTKKGGVSEGIFSELNVGLHVGDELKRVLQNRSIIAKSLGIEPEDITCGEQVHGTNIQTVTAKDKGRGATDWANSFLKTDGMITGVRGIPLMVVTADCASVSFYDPKHKAIGIAHSGKKGTESKIVQRVVEIMGEEYGTKPVDLVVGIGPCIYPCCYEVDIPGQIQKQLLESGVLQNNIENSGICTFCHSEELYSFRADKGKTGRFANIVMLK